VRSQPTAGQASIEYVGAIALVALVFIFAAPAVGAPSIAGAVVREIKHALCIVSGDICTSGDAARVGLAPCPLRSETSGGEGSITAFSIEVGGKWVLTVTPQSDGSVAVIRTAGGSVGLVAGVGGGLSLGPVRFEPSAEGAARGRVQVARGWVFPDSATAARFLEHSVSNGFDGDEWPWAWQSGEIGGEVGGSVGLGATDGRKGGDDGADDGDDGDEGIGGVLQVAGASVSGQGALGIKRSRDGSTTLYTRISLEGPELAVSFFPPVVTRGRNEVIAEYTRDRAGKPRELVFRTAAPSDGGTVTDTVARLDLRDPANLMAARQFIDSPVPWESIGGPGKQAVMDRIATHGIVETSVSKIDDRSRGAAASVKLGLKFGLGAKKVKVLRRLVAATATVGGGLTGKRLDCLPAAR